MSLLPDLTRRRREPELMDQPNLEVGAHVRALRALERVNFWSGTAQVLWREVSALRRIPSTEPLRVLDVASGAGDVAIRLWHRARHAGFGMQVEGCDKSATAVGHAQQRAAASRADVRFFSLDVFREPIPGPYDVVSCGLFLHHLDDGDAIELLRRMAAAARQMVLINDLVRSRIGYLLAYLGGRVLSRSPVVHVDGPLSVQGAYTPAEALDLARQAGLSAATVRRCWPCRYVLTWQPDRTGEP